LIGTPDRGELYGNCLKGKSPDARGIRAIVLERGRGKKDLCLA